MEYGESRQCHEETSTSHSGEPLNAPAIFLSHSGKQKHFVEDLYNALKSANHTTAFFDKHSLPKASPFPDHIRKAALGCRLGVVILSEDFLTSKWPMLELEMLVLQRGPNAKVLPVCYMLNFENLKEASNISRWRTKWQEYIEDGKHVDRWEKAVLALAQHNGEVYAENTSTTAYISKVVKHICSLVRCPVPYDVSLVQGHQRLAEEVASIFDGVKASCPEESTCMVGLHGVGGSGKTTLCQTMVNYYTSEYVGRSCLIEFPTNCDKLEIAQACKRALRRLTDLGNELLDQVNSFDQVIPLMDHVKRYDVFLAIDNVWYDSWEHAGRLLGVGFSTGSKVLLTSRSEPVVKGLVVQHATKYRVDPLPTPGREEAFQILQEGFDLGDLRSLLDSIQIKVLTERCRFGGNYHPLALKALACYVKRACMFEEDFENRKHCLSIVLEEIKNADLQTVENVIRLSYDNLSQIKKDVFLDIAVFLEPRDDAKLSLNSKDFSMIRSWMCAFYKELSETQINAHIAGLALDGLIQVEADQEGTGKTIRMHDLYLDLAHKEAANSPRFLVTGSTIPGEEVDWEKVERVRLKNEDKPFLEEVRSNKCKKLQILYMLGVTITSGEMQLDCMQSLRVLLLERVKLRSEQQRTACPGRLIKLSALVQLQLLFVEKCDFVESIAGFDALPNLRSLYIKGCPSLKKLEGLSGLVRLEELDVFECASLKTMSCLAQAKRAPLLSGSSKEEKEGGSLSPSLLRVVVAECRALEKMPDVGGLTRLVCLILVNNRALEVKLGGMYFSSTLKCLGIFGCKSLRRWPSLNECEHLEEVAASQSIIGDTLLVQKLPKLRKLLLEFCIWSCSDLFNEQWKHATRLQELTVVSCGSIVKLEVGCLMSSLKVLKVWNCSALEEIGDLSALHRLEELNIKTCCRLKVVGGLVGIAPHLKRLTLEECESFEESSLPDVGLLVNNMQELSIRGCKRRDSDVDSTSTSTSWGIKTLTGGIKLSFECVTTFNKRSDQAA